MKRHTRMFINVVALGTLTLASAISHARSPIHLAKPKDRSEQAERKFNRAMTLMDAKKFVDASSLLEESFALAPAIGTELHMALCYENMGELVRPLLHYDAVIKTGTERRDWPRVDFAREHAKALRRKVPKLVLDVSPELLTLEGFVVEIEGHQVDRKHLTGSPIEPILLESGKYEVHAKINGREIQEDTVEMRRFKHVTLHIAKPSLSGRTWAAIGFGALGVGGFVTAAVSYKYASDNWSMAVRDCKKHDPNDCSPYAREAGKPFFDKSLWQANLATAAITVGSVAATSSALLLFWPAKRRQESTGHAFVVPMFDKTNVGLNFVGTF